MRKSRAPVTVAGSLEIERWRVSRGAAAPGATVRARTRVTNKPRVAAASLVSVVGGSPWESAAWSDGGPVTLTDRSNPMLGRYHRRAGGWRHRDQPISLG